jgi:hypothetical protein
MCKDCKSQNNKKNKLMKNFCEFKSQLEIHENERVHSKIRTK